MMYRTVTIRPRISKNIIKVGAQMVTRLEGHVSPFPEYEGPYNVIPRLTAQSLDTDNKVLVDDVNVHEIPITYTSNPQDGLTVLIG